MHVIADTTFRAILDAAPDAMLVVTPLGEIVYVNQQAEFLFGYNREELLEQSVEMLVPERLRHIHQHHRAGYANNPHVRSMGRGQELYARHKSGREIPVEISLSPIRTEHGLLISNAFRDLSERSKHDSELERNNAQLRLVFEQLPAITWTRGAATIRDLNSQIT